MRKPSWQLRLFSALARATFKFPSGAIRNHKILRVILDGNLVFTGLMGLFQRSAKIKLKDIPTVEMWSGERQETPVLYYLHGGAFIFGSAATHRSLATALAKEMQGRAIVPNYRLAPEHPFPAAFEDALNGYLELLDQGIESRQIVMAGDSAGGCLVMALIAHLSENDLPQPACAVTFSALTDMRAENPSLTANTGSEAVLYAKRFPEVNALYLKDADPKDPRCSPIFGDFASAQPILMQAAEQEILVDDTLLMVEKLQGQGIDATKSIYPSGFHVFQALHSFVPEARLAIKEFGSFTRKHLTALPNDS